MLKGPQTRGGGLAQALQIEAQGAGAGCSQAADALAEQHRGAAKVAPFQVMVGHGDLQDALQDRAAGPLGLVPQLLEAVVAGVPLAASVKRGSAIRLASSGS